MSGGPDDTSGIWGVPAQLDKDLRRLLKREGFRSHRLTSARTLQRILGGNNEPYEVTLERFVSAINSLTDEDAEVLLDGFALSPETEHLVSLPERYEAIGQKLGLKIDATRTRVAAAVDRLQAQLTTGWYPKSPLPFRVPESHNGIVNEFVLVQTVVRNRKWHETRERFRFIAAFDEADYLAISSSQPGLIETLGDFVCERRSVDDHFEDRFFSTEPMRRGCTYDLMFRRLPPPDADDPEVLIGEWRAMHEPTRDAGFEVFFQGDAPKVIWCFSGLTHLQAPGRPASSNRLRLSARNSVRARFHDLYGGLFCGIAWEW